MPAKSEVFAGNYNAGLIELLHRQVDRRAVKMPAWAVQGAEKTDAQNGTKMEADHGREARQATVQIGQSVTTISPSLADNRPESK
jgi:hypothetical protein